MRMDFVHAWDATVGRIGSTCRAGRRPARLDRAPSMPWRCATIFRSVRIADIDVRHADIDDLRMSPPKAWTAPMAMTVEVKAIVNATTMRVTQTSADTVANATTMRATWASAVTMPPSLVRQHLGLRLRDERVHASGRRCPRVRR